MTRAGAALLLLAAAASAQPVLDDTSGPPAAPADPLPQADPAPAPETAEDVYFEFLFRAREGEEAEQGGDPITALERFEAARALLKDIRSRWPDWKASMIQFRERYCDEKIAALKPRAEEDRRRLGDAARELGFDPASAAPRPPSGPLRPPPLSTPTPAAPGSSPAPEPPPRTAPAPVFPAPLPGADAPGAVSDGSGGTREKLRVVAEELAATKEALANAQKELTEASAERDSLIQKLKVIEEDITNEKTRIQNVDADALQQENAQLRDKLGKLETQVGALRNSDAAAAFATLRREVDAAKQQLLTVRQENETLAKGTAELRDRLKNAQASGKGPTPADNRALRELLARQTAEESRRDQVRREVLAELNRLQIKSETLVTQINLLASSKFELTDAERGMLGFGPPAEPPPVAEASRTPANTRVPPAAAAIAREAESYFEKGQLDEAANRYEQILRDFPNNVYGLSNLGVVRLSQGRYDDAEKALRHAGELAPQDGFSRSTLGILLYLTGRYAEAAETLETAQRLMPNDAQTKSYLAMAKSRLGRSDPR